MRAWQGVLIVALLSAAPLRREPAEPLHTAPAGGPLSHEGRRADPSVSRLARPLAHEAAPLSLRGVGPPGLREVAPSASSLPGPEREGRVLHVGPGQEIGSLSEAFKQASPGARIVVHPGIYREQTLTVDRPLVIIGLEGAVLDGQGEREILRITADGVTVRGLSFRNVGVSYVEDRAAIRVEKAGGCQVLDNTIENAFFGIYLAEAHDCLIARNRIHGRARKESASGNGIHLWYCRNITIEDNRVWGHRDGIYFEFVEDSRIRRNESRGNLRYGLHFMFSDGCRYEDNEFVDNKAGVAVMYTKRVSMVGNRFRDNWGPASYGLLLKDITDSEIVGNTFQRNSVALHAEGANRTEIVENLFRENGWAVKIMASSVGSRFSANVFSANAFDVATNSRQHYSSFTGNYWDAYRGYDLDGDGVGDVPFRPVRLFSYLVERNEPTLALLRSPFVDLLDLAERAFPLLTPETLKDERPLMRPPAIEPQTLGGAGLAWGESL